MQSVHRLVLCLLIGLPCESAAQSIEVSPPARPGALGPNLAPDGEGALMTWVEPASEDGAASLVRFSRFDDGSWSEPVTIAASPDIFVNWADFPSVVAAPDGSLVAHWPQYSPLATEDTPYAYDVRLARSTDGGATWSASGTAHNDGTPTEHGFVSFATRGDELWAAWLDGRAMVEEPPGPMSLRVGRLGDAGMTDVTLVDGRVCDCCQTGMAATASGLVLAYRDRNSDEVRDISVSTFRDGTWSEPASPGADHWEIPGCPVNGPQVAAHGDRVAMAWFSAPNDAPRVRLAISTDGGTHFQAPILMDDQDPVGRVDIDVAPDGTVTICWLAAGDDEGSAKLVCERVAADGTRSERLELADTGRARNAGFPRLARTADGLLIAWVHLTAGEPTRIRATVLSDGGPLSR
jgi:hypothetical protein